jgi:hypothetical protein
MLNNDYRNSFHTLGGKGGIARTSDGVR